VLSHLTRVEVRVRVRVRVKTRIRVRVRARWSARPALVTTTAVQRHRVGWGPASSAVVMLPDSVSACTQKYKGVGCAAT
jgi:hypothetical protein